MPAITPVVVTVLVAPVSTSVSLASTLPLALASPAFAVLPGLTPLSTTASAPLLSATATGASLVPVRLMVSTCVAVAPKSSVTVAVKLSVTLWPSLSA